MRRRVHAVVRRGVAGASRGLFFVVLQHAGLEYIFNRPYPGQLLCGGHMIPNDNTPNFIVAECLGLLV